MKLAYLVLTVLVVTGCSTTPKDNYENLYLRSEFTWWEAKPEFKFNRIEDSTDKQITAKIEADGNPYHIKVADDAWSKDKNCGYKYKKDREMVLNKWLELECNYDFNKLNTTPIQKPFELKPVSTGEYKFKLRMTTKGPSHIKVTRQ